MWNKSIYVVGPSVSRNPDSHNDSRDNGAKSTGKTTLCIAIAKRLNLEGPAFVSEVAREVIKSHGYTRAHIASLQMQRAILEAQVEKEEQGRESCPLQLCDRSAIDAVVYAVLTSTDDAAARTRQDILINSDAFQRALLHYRRSIFVLLTPVPDWLVDDGVRHMDDQARCLEIFRKVLTEMEIPYRELGPDMKFLAERVTVVMGMAKL